MTQPTADQSRQRLLQRRADRLAKRGAAGTVAASGTEVALFSAGRETFGIPTTDLREVVRVPSITRLPALPPWMPGVAAIRGELLTVVDVGAWLRIEAAGAPGCVAVVTHRRRAIALALEQVLGFVAVDVEAGRASASGSDRPLLALTEDLVGILDVARLLDGDLLVVTG